MFNDRPAGVARNSVTTQAMWDVGARVSYAFGFGQRPAVGRRPAAPTMMICIASADGGAGDLLGGMSGGGAENKRIRIELFASAQNLSTRQPDRLLRRDDVAVLRPANGGDAGAAD